jgi:fatty-acyl-CoA synthase
MTATAERTATKERVDDPIATRVDRLVQSDRVHGSMYTDEEIFQAELERIWYGSWVFVGHESEVAKPNDFVRKTVGLQDVVMTRDSSGEVHLVVNRCAHRGATICEGRRGNSSSFRCPYHGWTFKNDGSLIGYPYYQGYGARGELRLNMGTARVGIHEGFVFATFNPDSPSLTEYLGHAAAELERLTRLSPSGELDMSTGWLKHRTNCNWKLVMENETDGYHPQFTHGSIFSVTGSPIGALYGEKSTAVTRDLGGGHAENDLRPEFRKFAEPMRWFGSSASKVPDYLEAMRDRHGDAAEEVLIDGAPHLVVFPNLFIAEITIFMIQPLSVGRCVQYSTPVQFKGAPTMNRRLLSQSIGSVGPSGMLLADDADMYERNQRGVEMLQPEWLDLSRGLHRESVDDRGLLVGASNDETGMRAFWKQYRHLMKRQES